MQCLCLHLLFIYNSSFVSFFNLFHPLFQLFFRKFLYYELTTKAKKENSRKKMEVWLYWLGCWKALTHWRDPTTARHGNFWLLGYPPGPFRSSLFNLDLPDSSRRPMSMPGLVRTPVRRKRRSSRTPSLKPATPPSLPVAGLQVLATYPAKTRRLFWDQVIGIDY